MNLPPEQTHAIIAETDLQPSQTVVGWTDLTLSVPGSSADPTVSEHAIIPTTELQPDQDVVGWTALTPAGQSAAVPWTRISSPAEFPEGTTPPPGYSTGPLNLPAD